jgi:diguanylate cyclase (GGDEF)-like protein
MQAWWDTPAPVDPANDRVRTEIVRLFALTWLVGPLAAIGWMLTVEPGLVTAPWVVAGLVVCAGLIGASVLVLRRLLSYGARTPWLVPGLFAAPSMICAGWLIAGDPLNGFGLFLVWAQPLVWTLLPLRLALAQYAVAVACTSTVLALMARNQPDSADQIWGVGLLLAVTVALVSFMTRRLVSLTRAVERAAAVEQGRLDDRLRYLALYDPLTGLPNRNLILDRLDHALVAVNRTDQPASVILFDIDRFKLVNDTHGHDVGDELLAKVGQRLNEVIRPGDSMGRLGGDEFLVVSPGSDELGALVICERMIAELARPVMLRDHETTATASFGLSVARRGAVVADLLKQADLAMYAAKARGGGGPAVFDEAMRDSVSTALRTEIELRRALQDGQLFTVYQPIVDFTTGEITSLEVLARWSHPRRGLVLPADFIKVAEDALLIDALGEVVLSQACHTLASLGRSPIRLAINVSSVQLRRPDLPQRIARTLEEWDIHPSRVDLEITESVLLEDDEVVRDVLTRLHDLEVGLVLDDFGTGYASFSQLFQARPVALKIDRAFVASCDTAGLGAAVARAICGLTQDLRLRSIAEGIERPAQLERVRAFGCGEAQGNLLSPPMNAHEVAQLIARWRPPFPDLPRLLKG